MLARFIGKISFNNLILFAALSLLELVVFSLFYYRIGNFKRTIYLINLLGVGFVVYELLSMQIYDVANFQAYSKIVTPFLIVIMAFFYFFEVIKREETVPSEYLRLNYIISVFFGLEFILLLPMNFAINSDSDVIFYIWFARLIINLTFYVLLTQYLWKSGKNPKL